MASYLFRVAWAASKNVYVVIRNASGQVLDFSDDTFKSLGSATTPYAAATERTDIGGSGNSGYDYSLDLSKCNKALGFKQFSIEFFERVGGSPAIETDTPILVTPSPFTVEAAEIGRGRYDVDWAPAFTSTAGTTLRGLLTITRNGVPINVYALDSTATATITAREHGSGVDLYTSSPVTVESNGDFEVEQSTPGYTTDRVYQHTVEVECNGETVEFRAPIPVFG